MKFAHWAGLILLCTTIFLLWQVRELMMLLFAGIVLAVAIDTMSRIPQRYGFKRGQALAIASLTLVFGIGLWGLLIMPPLVDQIAELGSLVPVALSRIELLIEQGIERLPTEVEIPEFVFPNLLDLFNTISPQASQLLAQSLMFLNSSLTIAIGLFLVIILTILLILDPASYKNAFVRIFPAFYRSRVRYILSRCDLALRGWVVGIAINSLFIAVLSGVGLWGLRVPLVLAHATIAGLLNFIPNIGPTLSVIPPLIVALTVDPIKAIGVIIWYIFLQNFESGVLTPLVMARQVSLLPGLILLAQLLFASFFGFLGLFLALPLAAVMQVWIREVLVVDILDRWHSAGFDPPSFESDHTLLGDGVLSLKSPDAIDVQDSASSSSDQESESSQDAASHNDNPLGD